LRQIDVASGHHDAELCAVVTAWPDEPAHPVPEAEAAAPDAGLRALTRYDLDGDTFTPSKSGDYIMAADVDALAAAPVERYDRSWWHYADDCPVAPDAALTALTDARAALAAHRSSDPSTAPYCYVDPVQYPHPGHERSSDPSPGLAEKLMRHPNVEFPIAPAPGIHPWTLASDESE